MLEKFGCKEIVCTSSIARRWPCIWIWHVRSWRADMDYGCSGLPLNTPRLKCPTWSLENDADSQLTCFFSH